MKFWSKNIENWWSWKMTFCLVFSFFSFLLLGFSIFLSMQRLKAFIWGSFFSALWMVSSESWKYKKFALFLSENSVMLVSPPNNACLSKYFSSLGRPCSRIFGQAHSYIGYSNRNFFLIPKIKQEQLLKNWVSHIFFWSLIIGALGFLRHPDMMSLIHV